ncbi:UvrD-helicase domain-containing protein [Paenibacillus sp. P25]|nr:UvrD-helicase domain-containing protein [Paenibacillus sp. P25]
MEMEDFFVRKTRETGVTLNEVQRKAVLQTEGPLLLLASPGSGKTTTIIMRIGYLIEERRINPARIKAVTFSRASADDMKERFKRFFPGLPPVDFSTIHSLAFEVLCGIIFAKRGLLIRSLRAIWIWRTRNHGIRTVRRCIRRSFYGICSNPLWAIR